MQLHELKPPKGLKKRKKIVGRGPGSGHGKTSGRGHKGQKARAGRGILPGLEGGQMPLIRRLSKVGFNSPHKKNTQVVNLETLNRFKDKTKVDALLLKKNRLIQNIHRPIKILGVGELKKSLEVWANSFSKSAKEKIEKAGGQVNIVEKFSEETEKS